MRILVTGAYGFLGKHVCSELKKDTGSEEHDHIIELGGSSESFSLNLAKEIDCIHVLKTYKPDTIIHLAARVGGIGANQKYPGSFFYENMAMGLNLIEHSRKMGCQKFLLVSTVCAYPKHTPVPFKEESMWDGYPEETNAPYGIAKKALMEMLQAYRKQYDFNGITLVPVNMYGPHDNFNPEYSHVIPALILKFQDAIDNKSSVVSVWGNGEASREFLYVEDCASAIVDAIRCYDKPDPVNIGTGREITIKDLVGLIAKLMGFDGTIVFDTSKPNGQPRRCLDVSKAKEEFSFSAKTSLEDGLQKTIEWFRENKNAVIHNF